MFFIFVNIFLYFTEQWTKEKIWEEFFILFYSPKVGKTVFDLIKRKTIFLHFQLLSKLRNKFFLSVATYVCMLNKKLKNDADFKGVQAKFAHAL